MVILEKIASHFLTFAKMNPIDKEKLKIAVETYCKLHKTKGKLHTFTAYKNGGVNKATIYRCFVKVPTQTPELHYQDDGWTTSKTPERPI